MTPGVFISSGRWKLTCFPYSFHEIWFGFCRGPVRWRKRSWLHDWVWEFYETKCHLHTNYLRHFINLCVVFHHHHNGWRDIMLVRLHLFYPPELPCLLWSQVSFFKRDHIPLLPLCATFYCFYIREESKMNIFFNFSLYEKM